VNRVKISLDHKRIRCLIWLVLTLFVLLGYSLQSVAGTAYYSMLMQAYGTVSSPPIILENGTAGSSTIYTNSTYAKASIAAPAPTPTYFPNDYNNVTGTHLSGSVPGSVQTIDTDYFVVRSSGTATSTTAYNPSGHNLLGSTTLVSGTTTDLASNNSVYMTFGSYASETSSQPLYAHNESTSIAGTGYYLLKLGGADSAGTEFSADAGSTTGRKSIGKFAYQLTGVSSIPASTWTVYYRAYKGHQNIAAHGDVDILVRMSNGTIRSTIATNVANSSAIENSYSTVSGTYSWASYTVVDQTDYLEIDYYIEVTAVKAGYLVYLRIDDSNLATADQTRVGNIILPSQYTCEVEFTGSSNTETWNQLVWTVDSSWTVDSVIVTIQVYNYTLGAYPTSGNGYDSYISSMANADQARNQIITSSPIHFRDVSGNWKIKAKGVKTTATQFDFKADWVEFKPTHYTEYTVSTEFLFASMTMNTPTQLNFTVVTQYNVSSVNVTIQVWNYSSSTFVTSGEGYANYTSSGSNETTNLSINTDPQFYSSGGNAKIKVTGVLKTTSTYQQETNQVKLVYKYDASSTYDYVLAVTEQEGANWAINLLVYANSSIARLSNTTISFRDGTTSDQIIINGGTIIQSEGPSYNLTSSSTIYIKMSNLNATSSGTSCIYAYLKILVPGTTTYLLYRIEFEIT
jgi:hypothetical protein